MNDKTFLQALCELNQREIREITDLAVFCWMSLQQRGTSVADVTASIEDEYRREAVAHVLFYMLLQSLFYRARDRNLLSREQYDELCSYLNSLVGGMKQPFAALSLTETFMS